jgi:hypothetical protein
MLFNSTSWWQQCVVEEVLLIVDRSKERQRQEGARNKI